MTRSFTILEDDDGIRVDRWFKRHEPETSFNLVSRWARTGVLRIDGAKTDPGDRLKTGQVMTMPPAEPVAPPMEGVQPRRLLTPDEVEYAQSLVIHRDKHALVINKPPGLATQGGTGTIMHVDLLLDALMFDSHVRPKLVHRLDKDTSGVLLLARTAHGAAFFSKAFAQRTARKIYWALTVGTPEPHSGEIDAPLAKQPGSGGEKMHVDPDNGQSAKTIYRVIDHAAARTGWVEFQPQTGRTHQIRVHAAAIGHPIVGDAKYGGKDSFLTGGISRKLHLHARRLVIEHPEGATLDITAELPQHMEESFRMVGFTPADGDALPMDQVRFKDTPQGKAKFEAAEAKQRRLARRGERRSRGSDK